MGYCFLLFKQTMIQKLRALLVIIPRVLSSPYPQSQILSDVLMTDTVITTDLKIRLADATLATQRDLALKVSSIINTRVYIFDPACYFTTPPFETVLYDDIRTVRKENRTALLSSAAQSVIPSAELYRQLVDPHNISSDSFGVYIKS